MQSHGVRRTSSIEEDTRSEFGLECKLLMAKRAESYEPGRLGRAAAMGSQGMLETGGGRMCRIPGED